MIKIFSLFFSIFLFPSLNAKEANFNLVSGSISNTVLEPPQAVSVPKDPVSYNPQVPKVNVVNGSFCDEGIDLIVAGAEPLSLRRFYNHLGHKNMAFGHWNINPESFLLHNFEFTVCNRESFVSVGERSGSIFLYGNRSGNEYSINHDKLNGYTNASNLYSNGHYHPLNRKIKFFRNYTNNRGSEFSYCGSIEDGSGRIRKFESKKRVWPTNEHYEISTPESRLGQGRPTPLYPYPPYLVPLTEERLPNGNILTYKYTNYNCYQYGGYYAKVSDYYILDSIAAHSEKGTFLGSLKFEYSPCRLNIRVKGSDNREALYNLEGLTIKSQPDHKLRFATSPNRPNQEFVTGHTKHHYWDHNHIVVSRGEGTAYLRTEYQDKTQKVIRQYAPVGENGKEEPIVSYDYQDHATFVYDGENNLTKYTYNDDNRIETITKYQGESPYRIERNIWESHTGNLKKKTVEDPSEKVYLVLEYTYDERQNLILETMGDGNEEYCITRTFSSDGFNLKTSESDNLEKKVTFDYLPGTNLLTRQLVYVEGKISKRLFHTYADGAICIKTVLDDGCSLDQDDLTGVTFRKITVVHPKQSIPCYGLPEIVEERTIDGQGNELLLKKVHYTYHPSGQIVKEEHYDSNNELRYCIYNEYNEKEQLVGKTDPLGHKIEFAYDSNHKLIETKGPRKDQFRKFSYDVAERLVKIEEKLEDGFLKNEKIYDRTGRVIAEIDECGFKTAFVYDGLGRVTQIVYPDGSSGKREYDLLNNIVLEVDGNGYETKKEFNYRNQPLFIQYPDGSSEHYKYNLNGTLAEHTDKNGAITVYSYDAFDNPIEISIYSSSGDFLKKTSASYTPFQKLSETDGEGVTTFFSYDFAGREIAKEKAGKKIHFFYDSLGRLFKTEEGDTVYITEFDYLDRPIEKRRETLAGKILTCERYEYDAAGNQTKIIRSKGAFETEYDARGLPIVKRDPLGNETKCLYSYEGGLVKTLINPKGIKTIQNHDCRGREIETAKINTSGEEIYKSENLYDKNGNIIQTTHHIFEGTTPIKSITHCKSYLPGNLLTELIEAGEKKTQFLYDSKGRMCSKIKPDGTALNYEYDDLGRLTRFYSSDCDYQYTYDCNDRITNVYETLSKKKTIRSYNSLGNILKEELANDLAISHRYNVDGLKIQTSIPGKRTIDYTYQGGFLHQISYNGHTHTYIDRDLDGNLSHAKLPGKLGEIQIERDAFFRWQNFSSPFYHSSFKDGYDSVGNLSAYTYTDGLGTVEAHYEYDDLNQLISENEHAYLWDSLSNRLKKDSFEYQINDLCQITNDGETNYKYDQNGNLLFDGKRSYTYDSQDRLIRVEEGRHSYDYIYDPFHRRLSKTYSYWGYDWDTSLYLWDGENEIGKKDAFYGSIDELRILGEGFGAEIGAAVLLELNGTAYVPIHDHRGCLVSLIHLDKKKLSESYRYTAYGEELTDSKLSPWRFSNKRIDPETGFLYFGKRYYFPTLGRWITPDPQGFQDGPNLYAYLHNSPLLYFDLYGLRCTSFSETRNAIDFFDWLAYETGNVIESIGQHLIPIPGIRDVVECSGRWLRGGDFWECCSYWKAQHEVFFLGNENLTEITNLSLTVNGICNSREEVIKKATYQMEKYGTESCMVAYLASRGLITDVLAGGLAKLGIVTAGERLIARNIALTLRDNPELRIQGEAHSRGGTNMMNVGKLLPETYNERMSIYTYGSATLIPDGAFGEVKNYVSEIDFVSATNVISYLISKLGFSDHVSFLPKSSNNPYKEHCIMGDTYKKAINLNGEKFRSFK